MGIVSSQPEAIAVELEPAFTSRLRSAGVDEFRISYRRFRKGKPEGAKGERPTTNKPHEEPAPHDDMEDMFEFEAEGNKLYEMIADFRGLYRRYRMGSAFGAKGDVAAISRRLTVAHARMVPVAQLSAFLRQQMAQIFPAPGSRSSFHLHLGAGRLGLGLVVPAIARSQVPFAILQRPSKAWGPVLESGTGRADVVVSGEVICRDLVVVRDLTGLPPSEPSQPDLLVLSEDPLLLHLLVSTATSFSISLGASMLDVVVPLLEKLPIQPPGEKRPALYAAENDHKMVSELAKALEGRVEVIPCMVDRICTDRIIEAQGVEVKCEPYDGEMVLMQRAGNGLQPPFEGDLVRQPLMEAQASYFCRRKFLLVNGTHTTLAFMTLCLKQKDRGESGVGEFQLIDWDPKTCGDKYYREIWAWAVARLLMLLWEHELDVLLHAHAAKSDAQLCDELLDYAKATLKRFSSIPDTTSRVLKGGVANRWETRLNSVNDFLSTNTRLTPIAAVLLDKAGLRLPYIRRVVRELCEASHCFTGRLLPHHAGKVICT